jgi:hypothetical protein
VANGASLDRKRYDSIIAIQQNCRRKDTPKIGWILIAVGAFLIFFWHLAYSPYFSSQF